MVNNPSGSMPGLYASWDFNSGQGDILYDHSGNQNHGTIIEQLRKDLHQPILIPEKSIPQFKKELMLLAMVILLLVGPGTYIENIIINKNII